MAAKTQELGERAAKQHVLEIRLMDGETLTAELGDDGQTARRDLASLQTMVDSDAFVLFGETALARGREVRYVVLHEVDENTGGGFLETLKSKVGGGDGMTSHDTEQMQRRSTGTRAGSDGGPGFADQWVGYGRRPWSETKPFFMTSEFLTLAGIVAALAIAMGVLDNFDAPRGWLYITIIGAAYMVSRGLAKSGTRDPNPEDKYRQNY